MTRATMARMPVADEDLARRVEAVDVDYCTARLSFIAALPGNPHRAAVASHGSAVAMRAPGMRNLMFHRLCLPDDTLLPDRLDAALEAVTEPGLPSRVDVIPTLPSRLLLPALTRRRFVCTGFYSALYGLAEAPVRERSFAGRIRPMEADEIDRWIEIYSQGFGFSTDQVDMGASLRGLMDRPEADLLVAEVDGRIASIACLWVHGPTGYLAVAATLPDARGRGCHTALLDARIRRAADRGCDLVAAHAAVGSASQRNMEGAGLRLAFHKAIWMRPATSRSS